MAGALELVAVLAVLVGTLLDELAVVLELVVGVLVVVLVVAVLVVVVVVLDVHWLPASALTVLAACSRSSVSRGLTPPRLLTAPASPPAALEAAPHCPAPASPVTEASCELRLAA